MFQPWVGWRTLRDDSRVRSCSLCIAIAEAQASEYDQLVLVDSPCPAVKGVWRVGLLWD
jgi:hypothetical protein